MLAYWRIVGLKTVPVNKGEKIYELYEPGTDGELVKESVQEWLCDNRHQINECISIALRNNEQSYAEWFKYIEEKSGPMNWPCTVSRESSVSIPVCTIGATFGQP